MALHFPDYDATFIHIPKTGGSSLLVWSENHIDNFVYYKKHCSVKEAKSHWNNVGFTFSFVRNPYDRMVSYFEFLGQNAKSRIDARLSGKKVKRNSSDEVDQALVAYYSLGFENWLEDLLAKKDNAYNLGKFQFERSSPYCCWLDDDVDLIIKIENIQSEFKKIQKILDCYQALPLHNTSNHENYKNYYNNRTRFIIEKLFAQDLERFDYEF